MTIELIALIHVVINTVGSIVLQRRFFKAPVVLHAATVAFTMLWLGVIGAWLGWWLFIELGAVVGTGVIVYQYRLFKKEEAHKEKLWADFEFMQAKPVNEPEQREHRKPRTFVPGQHQLPH